MGIKVYNPYTPSRRNMTGLDFDVITTDKPEKSLLAPKSKTAGRNNQGKITVRHHGGGNRQKYRIIDFKRNKDDIPAKVATIEYDPNRTANIALLVYADGTKTYILAPAGLKVGDTLMNGAEAEVRVLKRAAEPEKATKDDIFYMMLNSIDYYDKVSGRFVHKSARSEYYDEVVFQTCLSDTNAFSVYRSYYATEDTDEEKISSGTVETEQEYSQYCDGSSFISVFPKTKNWENISNSIISMDKVIDIPDQERMFTKEGMPGYAYKTNPTNVIMSNSCLFPQEYAFGFLQDQSLWDIAEITNYQGRKCYIINGNTTPEYGAQMRVDTFEFIVDANTGVLMRYDGYNENGELCDFMHTDNIKFEEESEPVEVLPDGIMEEYTEQKPDYYY